MHWLLFFTVLRYKTAIKAFRSKLLPFALFTTHTLLNKNYNGRKAQNAIVSRWKTQFSTGLFFGYFPQNSSRNIPKLQKQNFQETQGIFGQNSRIFSKLNISANFVCIHKENSFRPTFKCTKTEANIENQGIFWKT